MMYEVLSTFSRKTGAIAAEYYLKKLNKKPYAYIGKNINFDFTPDLDRNRQYMIFQEKGLEIIIIPLKNGYLKFIYKDQENIKKLAAMLGNFQKKIDLSINACHGVKEMEKLNEDLEDKVDSSIKQIRKNEKIIIAQSKQAVMGEMMEMIAHQWRQPITAIGMIFAGAIGLKLNSYAFIKKEAMNRENSKKYDNFLLFMNAFLMFLGMTLIYQQFFG